QAKGRIERSWRTHRDRLAAAARARLAQLRRAVVEVHQRLDNSLAVVHRGTLLLHAPPADAPQIRTATHGELQAATPRSLAAPAQLQPKPCQHSANHRWKRSYKTPPADTSMDRFAGHLTDRLQAAQHVRVPMLCAHFRARKKTHVR